MAEQEQARPLGKDGDIFGQGAYHGGDVWGAARCLGVPVDQILDLSASLNPLGPPAGMVEQVAQGCSLICHYPDRQNLELREALARRHDLKPGNILPGNGSTALMRVVARALEASVTALVAPCFGEFPRSLALAGVHFHYFFTREKEHFILTQEDLERLWQEDFTCLILTSPQTPSGGLVPQDILDQILEVARRRRAWVVLDEAFIDFAPPEAALWSAPRVLEHPRLLVLRSLTKFYCLAGLRLGYLMAHADTIATLAPLGLPWGVNTLAQRAGIFCLEQDDYAVKTRQAVDRWREELRGRLEGLGLPTMPSVANYLLTTLPPDGPDAATVAQRLAGQGILVRDCASFPGCHERHLRLAVCTSQEQDRLLPALEEALA